jgi:hypothetical protein
MSYYDALRSAHGAVTNLPRVPDDLRNSVYPSIDQAKQILELALGNGVEYEAAKETALVAHTCILSAVSRLRVDIEAFSELGSNPEVVNYLRWLEELVETWALRDMALEYHNQLSYVAASNSPPVNHSYELANNASVNGGGGGGGGGGEYGDDGGGGGDGYQGGGSGGVDGNYVSAALPGDNTNTAEIIYRHAEQAMAVAEQAVLANDRNLSARSFHFAVV